MGQGVLVEWGVDGVECQLRDEGTPAQDRHALLTTTALAQSEHSRHPTKPPHLSAITTHVVQPSPIQITQDGHLVGFGQASEHLRWMQGWTDGWMGMDGWMDGCDG